MTDLTAPHADDAPPPQIQMPKDRTRSLVILGVSLVVVLIGMVFVVLRNQSDDPNVSDTEAIANVLAKMSENAELQGCRASFAAQLVSGPQAVALKALAQYGVESGEFQAATDQLHPDRNQHLVAMSTSEPETFLDLCRSTDFTQPADVPSDPSDEPALPRQGEPYASCGAAALAGATPLCKDDPGWNPDLDRDGDGIACE